MRVHHIPWRCFVGILAGLVLLGLCASLTVSADANTNPPLPASATPARVTVVQGIHVYEDGGKFLIDVKTNSTPTFKSFELNHPRRIVVNMMNARLNSDRHYYAVGKGNVKSVRLAQFSSVPSKTVRAVITTGGKIDYTIQGEATAVRLAVPFDGNATDKYPAQQLASVTPSPKNVLATERPATIVRGINARLEGNQLVVAIQADGVLHYRAFELDRPQRLVVDMSSVNLRAPKRVVNVRQGDLTVVRLGQLISGDSRVVRAVMDQSRKTTFKVESSNEGLKFFFPLSRESVQDNSKSVLSSSSKSADVQVASLATPEPVLVSAWVKEAKAKSPETWGALPEKLQAPARPGHHAKSPAELSPSEVVHEEAQPEKKLPVEATVAKAEEPVEIATPKEPAPRVSPPNSVDPSPKPPAPVQSPVTTTANSAVQTATPPAVTATSPGDTISLDLRDVDLRDFFRLISEVSGLNVVLDPSVKGSLTIALRDVPWEQALEIVLRNNQLGKQLDGNVLRIVSLKTLEEEQNARRGVLESQRAEEEAAARQTYIRTPNYLKAEDVKVVLEEMLNRGSAKGSGVAGSVMVFPKQKVSQQNQQDTERAVNNFVVLYTTPKKMADIDELLKVIDVKGQQVEIEARVVTSTDKFLRDLGVQFGTQLSTTSKNHVISGLPSLNNDNISLGAASPTSGVSYVYTSAHALIDAYISAAESKGTTKVLSRPRFVTQNYAKGIVTQGYKVPLQTSVNNTVSSQYVEANLRLAVTPQITKDGEIILDTEVKNDSPDFSQTVNGQPTIQSQEIVTTVRMRDGETVVIGGVMIDQNNTTTRQVPGLGNLPVIGNLFKNKSVGKTRQELLFFLTPKILK